MSLFSFRAFIIFWFARIFGTMGNQMMMVAVGWQMYDLTNSAWDLGLVGLLEFLPALPLSLVAGHVADRYDRRLILAGCMVLQGIVSGVLLIAVIGGWETRSLLLGLALLLGTARAFQMPAQQALVPMLVPPNVLPRAISFSSAGMQGAIIAGPALGGALYTLGAEAAFGVSVTLFATACLMLIQVRYKRVATVHEPATLHVLLAGFRFIRQRKAILGAISLDLFAVLLGGATSLLPIYAKDILHLGPLGLGMLRSSPAIGALVVSVILTRWPITRRVGRMMLGAVAIYGVCMLVFAVSTTFMLSLFALTLSGAADMVSVVVRQTLIQLDTPNEMRGRVSAVSSLFIGASNQLGEFRAGSMAALLGPVGSVLVGGVGTLVIAGAWLKLFPDLANRERLDERREQEQVA